MSAAVEDVQVQANAARQCSNFTYKGRCGYANCRFLHDESARQAALEERAQAKQATISRSSASIRPCDVPPPPQGRPSVPASLRFLLGGESVRSHPYLKKFAAMPWLQRLMDSPFCQKLFHVQGKRLRKELTEAIGLLHACERALSKHAGKEDDGSKGRPVTIVDLCSGKGFGSLVLACSFPDSQVIAVDLNPNMDLAHFGLCPNLSFREMNLESASTTGELVDMLTSRPQDGLVLLVGVHLCGMLSIHAARLFRQVPRPAALVLAPCCLDKRLPGIKQRAKRLGIDPYVYWCLKLLIEEVPASCRRELFQDDDMQTSRNSFVIGLKS